jgi:hypothetical protein
MAHMGPTMTTTQIPATSKAARVMAHQGQVHLCEYSRLRMYVELVLLRDAPPIAPHSCHKHCPTVLFRVNGNEWHPIVGCSKLCVQGEQSGHATHWFWWAAINELARCSSLFSSHSPVGGPGCILPAPGLDTLAASSRQLGALFYKLLCKLAKQNSETYAIMWIMSDTRSAAPAPRYVRFHVTCTRPCQPVQHRMAD